MNDDTTKQRRTLYNAERERESVCSQMSLTPLLHSGPFLFWITHPTNLQNALLCFAHIYLVITAPSTIIITAISRYLMYILLRMSLNLIDKQVTMF